MRDHDEKEPDSNRTESSPPPEQKQPKREPYDTLSEDNPQICRGYD